MPGRRVSFRLLIAAVSLARASASSQRGPSSQKLFVALRSSDPMTRAAALQTLRSTRGALSGRGVSVVLLETLQRENQLVARTWLESHGTEGIVDTYGEEYAEYVGQLADECLSHCDLSNPLAVIALGEAYTDMSPTFERLATKHGAVLLPGLIEASKASDDEMRRTAVGKIGIISAVSRDLSSSDRHAADSIIFLALVDRSDSYVAESAARAVGILADRGYAVSPERRTTFHRAIVALADSPDEDQRLSAIRSLAKFRDRTDLPLLQDISQRDTAHSVSGGRVSYPVRIEAEKARAIIRRP